MTDEQGYPIAGATVRVDATSEGGSVVRSHSSESGIDGSYQIVGVEKAADTVEAIVWASAKGYVAKRKRVSNAWIESADKRNSIDFTLVRATSSVSGRVLDTTGSPVADAIVSLLDCEPEPGRLGSASRIRLATVRTDKAGFLEIGVSLEGVCDFAVTKAGYGLGFFSQVPTGTDNAVFVLGSAGAIAGTVRLVDGTPASGATVGVLCQGLPAGSFADPPWYPVVAYSALTDASGNYVVSGLGRAYAHTVGVRMKEGMDILSWLGTDAEGLRTNVRVKDGQITRGVDFILPSAARVYGKVTDASSGRPVHPVNVWVYIEKPEDSAEEDGLPDKLLSNDTDGSYNVAIDLTGPRQVRICWSPCRTSIHADDESNEVGILQLAPGDAVEFNFAVPQGFFKARIRFVDVTGAPLEHIGGGVRIAGAHGLGRDGLIDALDGDGLVPDDGELYCRGLVSGQMYEAVGYRRIGGRILTLGVSTPFTNDAGGKTLEIEVMCSSYEGLGGIEGSLADAEGNPVSNTSIQCEAVLADGKKLSDVCHAPTTVTDANGDFVMLHALPDGLHPKLMLTFVGPDYEQSVITKNVEIVAGEVTNLGFLILNPISDQEFNALIQAGQ